MGLITRSTSRVVAQVFMARSSVMQRSGSSFMGVVSADRSMRGSPPVNYTRFASQRFASMQAATELSQFLVDEIKMEKESAKERLGDEGAQSPTDPPPGFEIKSDEAEVKFIKERDGFKITITLNINDTVDESTFMEEEDQEAEGARRGPPLLFRVDITKGDQTLAFDLQALDEAPGEPQNEPSEAFTVEQICIYRGELTERVYSSAGAVLDGNLYGCLVAYLQAHGVDRPLVDRLTTFADRYEHAQYVAMLQKIQEFVKQ